MNNTMDTREKITQIREELVKHIVNDTRGEQPNQGVLSGNPGLSLFFYYHYKQTGNESDLSLMEDLIANHLNGVETLVMNPYYCNGLAGFNWLMRFYAREEALELSDSMQEILEMLDAYVVDAYSFALEVGNFDFLHGSCGLLQYLLTTQEAATYARDFVQRLDETKIQIDEDRIAWISNITFWERNEGVFNFGLAHGMPAILLMLSKIINGNYLEDDQTARKLLAGCVRFILSEKLDAGCASTFPHYFSDDVPRAESRLAWCYGDLGICITLWVAGDTLDDPFFKEEAITICLKTTKRKDPLDTGIMDAGICHGSTGVALLYLRLYQLTGVEDFRRAADFWIEDTMQRAHFEDGQAGFKMWTKDGYLNEVNVLNGIAGIGLVLLTHAMETPGNWEDLLLIY